MLPILLFILMGCSTPFYNSVWKIEENKKPLLVFDSGNDLTLSCSNDSTMLYVELYTANTTTINKIGRLGMTIWINTGRIPRKKYGIHYPMPTTGFSVAKLPQSSFGANPFQSIALTEQGSKSSIMYQLTELESISPIITITPQSYLYQLSLPFALADIDFRNSKEVTVSISSFQNSKGIYDSSLESSEVIKKRLDAYKANPLYVEKIGALMPSYYTFILSSGK